MRIHILAWSAVVVLTAAVGRADDAFPPLKLVSVPGTLDGVLQPVRYWIPATASSTPTPILISLHSWSADGSQDRSDWLRQAVARGWIYVQPNFRGVNDHPEACGSPLARQDVLDALDWAGREFQIDRECIYLAGVSGGGHMTMQMAAHHPERFSAASAWVGPTDLAEWYRFHARNGRPEKYARMIAACCGGPPGASPEVDAQYQARSPVFHLGRVGDLHLDLNTGVQDGITGSVPIHHTLRAYNAVARAHGDGEIPSGLMDELWSQGRQCKSLPAPVIFDPLYGRDILLRLSSGNTRVTVFEGTHEAIVPAGCEWLANQRRQTSP